MSEQMNKCAHPACNCVIEGDAEYCSSFCRNARESTETNCKCGHADCAAAATDILEKVKHARTTLDNAQSV